MNPTEETAAPRPPRPVITPAGRPFWDGLREHRLLIQRCEGCRSWIHYPRVRCPRCGCGHLVFEPVAPHGRIYSFTIARQATAPPFVDEVPQLIAIVELDCGVHMTSSLVTDDPTRLAVGQEVDGVFDDGDDGITLIRFRPVARSNPS